VLLTEDGVGSVMVGLDGHRGWIYYLAVAPKARRRGIGRALMSAAEAWLRQQGAPKLQLMVRQGNDEALAFYAALGLEQQPVVTLGRFLDVQT
jgi:ribosomal protein S18 acetylase RimI-like enzyme